MNPTVLILRIGSLGDTVVALPAFHRIRRLEPGARIVLLTNVPADGGVKAAPSYAVLAGSGLIDEYAEYQTPRRLSHVLALFRHFRGFKPRRVYYLMPRRGRRQRLRDRIFFLLCGVFDVVGLDATDADRAPRMRPEGRLYEPEGYRLLRSIGGSSGEYVAQGFDLHLSENETTRARAHLDALAGRAFFVLSLGTKLPVNDWGDANWQRTLELLTGTLAGQGMVIVGAASERERCEGLRQAWPGPTINLCGRLSVRESAAVLAEASLFLGHDSGPAHLASAVRTPAVTVFSSRNLPGVWFPFGNEENVLYQEIDCQGCNLEVCSVRQMQCIRSITPEQVARRVAHIRSGGARPVDRQAAHG